MVDVIKEKEKITDDLTDKYSRSIISLDEYETMIDKVNKIDSAKDLNAFQKLTGENDEIEKNDLNNKLSMLDNNKEEMVTVFSWRSTTVKPANGNAGKFVCVFGTNQIKVSDLPKGKTVLNVEAIFGLTEILVPKKIKVICKATPVMAGIFIPNIADDEDDDDRPELYITGTAVFGNITVIRM